MALLRLPNSFRALCLAGACALGLAAGPAPAQARQMDVLLAQLMTDGDGDSAPEAPSRGTRAGEGAARGGKTTSADAPSREAAACVGAGPGGELVIRPQPGCSMQATANVVRLATAALDVPRQTPECRRLSHCRPSRSFNRLHSLATLNYERTRLGGPRYWGQQY